MPRNLKVFIPLAREPTVHCNFNLSLSSPGLYLNCGGIALQVVRHPGREPAAELVRAGPLRGLARLLRRGDVEPQHAHGRGLPLPQRRRPQESATGQ